LPPVLLFVGLLGIYLPTASDDYVNPDAYASSLSAWRMATTGAPWMEQVAFDDLSGIRDTMRWQGKAPNGHLVAQRMYGPILLAVPFYWLASYSSEAAFTVFRGGMAAATCVALAMMLLFLSVRRQVGDIVAAGGVGIVALATPAWSIGANALWTHPLTMLGLAGAACAAARDRWALVGLSLGLGLWGRPHLALCAAVIGLGVAWSRRLPRVAVLVGIPATLGLAGLAVWNRYVFGIWDPLGAYAGREVSGTVPATPYGQGSANQLENWAGFLVSPDRGLFVWTPLLLLLLPAVIRSWRQLPDWSRWLAGSGIAYTVVQLALNSFMGGDGFYGYRHGLELLVSITPAYVLSWSSVGRWARAATPVIASVQLAAISLGAVTEEFMLNYRWTWTDNSFLYAWRTAPVFVTAYTVVFVVTALLLARWSRSGAPERVADPCTRIGSRTPELEREG
jgi:alpha-1,2-mannosyltransferase